MERRGCLGWDRLLVQGGGKGVVVEAYMYGGCRLT